MWTRFTERARRTVFFAQEEAAGLGESYVSTEHLLLALTRESDHVAARIFAGFHLTLPAIREKVEEGIRAEAKKGKMKKPQDMQLTPRAKQVIDSAYQEASNLNNNYIGTEHLLLGLLREDGGLGGRTLRMMGMDIDRARAEVSDLQKEGSKGDQTRATVSQVGGIPPLVQGTVGKLPASSPTASNKPQPGDLGLLRDTEAARPQIEWAVSSDALQRLQDAMRLKDHHEYRHLFAEGDFVLTETNTQVKLLIISSAASRTPGYFVRHLGGTSDGKTGWVLSEHFEWSGPDTRPFPPPVGAASDEAGTKPGTALSLNWLLSVVPREKGAELCLIEGMEPIIRTPTFGMVPLEGNPRPILDEELLRKMLLANLSEPQREMLQANREMHFGYVTPEPSCMRFQIHVHTSAKRLVVVCTYDGPAEENENSANGIAE